MSYDQQQQQQMPMAAYGTSQQPTSIYDLYGSTNPNFPQIDPRNVPYPSVAPAPSNMNAMDEQQAYIGHYDPSVWNKLLGGMPAVNHHEYY